MTDQVLSSDADFDLFKLSLDLPFIWMSFSVFPRVSEANNCVFMVLYALLSVVPVGA